jgi:hypothetical protein
MSDAVGGRLPCKTILYFYERKLRPRHGTQSLLDQALVAKEDIIVVLQLP